MKYCCCVCHKDIDKIVAGGITLDGHFLAFCSLTCGHTYNDRLGAELFNAAFKSGYLKDKEEK